MAGRGGWGTLRGMVGRLELWLVRHGETVASVERRLAGWSNPALTARGERQVTALRPVLAGVAFDGVWSSDLLRAVSSARVAWGEPTVDSRLREINFGALEGRSYAEVIAAAPQAFATFRDFANPGGESHGGFRDRIRGFVAALTDGRHLLFVHGGVIRVLTQDLGLDRFVATGSVVGLDWDGQRLLFVREPEE